MPGRWVEMCNGSSFRRVAGSFSQFPNRYYELPTRYGLSDAQHPWEWAVDDSEMLLCGDLRTLGRRRKALEIGRGIDVEGEFREIDESSRGAMRGDDAACAFRAAKRRECGKMWASEDRRHTATIVCVTSGGDGCSGSGCECVAKPCN